MIDIDREKKKELEQCSSAYLLGVLASGLETKDYPKFGRDLKSVTPAKGESHISFYIKPISNDPEPIFQLDTYFANQNLSTLYSGRQSEIWSFLDLYFFNEPDIDKRVEVVEQLLADKIIIFKPKITITPDDNGGERVYKNIQEVISIDDDRVLNPHDSYLAVPKVSDSATEFEKKLRGSVPIYLTDYPHVMQVPEYIICENYIFNTAEDGWKKHDRLFTWVYQSDFLRIEKLTSDDLESNANFFCTEHLDFWEKSYIMKRVKETSMNSLLEAKAGISELAATAEVVSQPKTRTSSEVEFINNFNQQAIAAQLCYEFKDLVNFHTSVKTNALTIVSGMSGTGKTQLALTYASAIGISQAASTLLVLPISPSYTEPADILGYLNTTTGLYMPSENGLVDFLVNAAKHPEQMHMVIFDEMNLAQVEHWFAPFISLLELDSENRNLCLYSSGTNCHNYSLYPCEINLGNNVLFVGTANIDETTKDFSDRLLDRANVITPCKVSFQELATMLNQEENAYSIEIDQGEPIDYATFRSWFNEKNSWAAFSDVELKFFDTLHDLVNKYDHQKGVSFRVLKRMGDYLNNIPQDNGSLCIAREEAIDILVTQRILTKIKGPIDQFEQLIGTVTSSGEIRNSELYDLFSSDLAQEISKFSRTLSEVKRKARELEANGFAN